MADTHIPMTYAQLKKLKNKIKTQEIRELSFGQKGKNSKAANFPITPKPKINYKDLGYFVRTL